MSSVPNLTRRKFIKAAGAAGAAIGFPTIVPSSVFGQDAPSNRIVMGCIGVGGMGRGNLNSFLGKSQTQVVAVCDVDENHRKQAKGMVDGRYNNDDCAMYHDYRDMIASEKLDAVSMATPDHWHALTAIEAAKNGCDVYGEKPFTRTLLEGRALCNAVDRYGRIWQTGSWQRSQGNFHKGAELVRNGRIGKIHTVEVGLPNGSASGTRPVQTPPSHVDWNMWLGPAPHTPYRGVLHFDWRWNLDWGGGQMLDWIGHHLDIAHWGLGFDETGPVHITGRGHFPEEGINTAPTSYRFYCTYKDGTRVIVANASQQPRGMGTRWIGENGWIWVDRGGRIEASDPKILQETVGPEETQLYRSRDHHANFLECVRTRRPAIAPHETAHRSASVGHLGLIAMTLGRAIKFDPDREQIIGDAAAQEMLGRAYREPWSL